jgi:hypothetical protein
MMYPEKLMLAAARVLETNFDAMEMRFAPGSADKKPCLRNALTRRSDFLLSGGTVTAEAAGSSPVVPAILPKRVR